MEKAVLKVGGMTCSSCAQGIVRHFEKKGFRNVHVAYDKGELELDLPEGTALTEIIKDVKGLGYSAIKKGEEKVETGLKHKINSLEFRFVTCLLFTVPLFFHMFINWQPLHLPLVQFFLAAPVILIGWFHFGRSAWGSLKTCNPNMDVLITVGSGSAFFYSCYGWYLHYGEIEVSHFLFFETSATIITLLLLGNIIEKKSLKQTQSALEELTRIQPQVARKIENAFTQQESTKEIPLEQLHKNDLILINAGEKIPADGLIYSGRAGIDQSMMTGESLPVEKAENDIVMCGTMVLSGHIKVIVQHSGADTILSKMIESVRKSALTKPQIQRLGDKVSAWFVPIVILIAVFTFVFSSRYLYLPVSEALLRSIAVLVISCPCAMGLATPTAVAVGIGWAARNGILVKGGDSLERLQEIDTIIFDKTGTLTEGKISISRINFYGEEQLSKFLLGYLENYSNHPLATSLSMRFSSETAPAPVVFSEIKEIPGSGVIAFDKQGNVYKVGSKKFTGIVSGSEKQMVFLTKNDNLLADVEFEDALRADAKELVHYFKQNGIRTVLLSGDQKSICDEIAFKLNIDEVYSEKLPDEKEAIVRQLQLKNKVAMAGDGINDAPSLAVASVGISMSGGTQIAKQTAEIVLVSQNELKSLTQIHFASRKTIQTIKQNLLWALLYNVVAIPVAASGYLSPMIASLSMAFSDVVVIGNSIRLRYIKLPDIK